MSEIALEHGLMFGKPIEFAMCRRCLGRHDPWEICPRVSTVAALGNLAEAWRAGAITALRFRRELYRVRRPSRGLRRHIRREKAASRRRG